ncbi:MAG: TetR/AcrR family transcriptional regulator [Thermoanaerobaculia bacterium]|nr:TetR/AcrR family transcriptional regulator [Thermoanaerobaculia bacterium]
MVQTTAAESERTVARKRAILEGASQVFRRRGLAATGMRDIAAELGMHVGNLYYYFENKQALLAFCQLDTLASLEELAASVEAAPRSAGEKLRRLIVGHVERLNERTPGSLAHLEVEALEEPWRSEVQRRRDAYEEVFRTLIRDGIAAGEFREVDPAVAALGVLGALNWTVKWFRPGGRRRAAQIGEEFADLLLNGLTGGPR